MKTKLLSIALFILFNSVESKSQSWQWAQRAGGGSFDWGNSIATDANGDIYVTGTFESASITFGSITLNNIGLSANMFIVKYNSAGTVLWAKSAGGGMGPSGGAGAQGDALCVDKNGNVYVTGLFGSTNITFGSFTLHNAGIYNIYTVKYDSGGNVIWAKVAADIDGNDASFGIGTDASGNIYLTGLFDGWHLRFDNDSITSFGYEDAFIAKYDSSGNFKWARSAGGDDDNDGAQAISVDANGNSCITGYFNSYKCIFGSDTLQNSGWSDFFIAKYDSSGNYLWAKAAGNDYIDGGSGLTTDAFGNIYATGTFSSDSIVFDNFTIDSARMFVVKYDPNGNVIWAKNAGGIYDNPFPLSITTDQYDDILITGYFSSNNLTLDSFTLINPYPSGEDLFIVKYDSVFNALWAERAGGNDDDEGHSLTTDSNGNIYMTGYFRSDSIRFGSDVLLNASPSGLDIFLAKFGNSFTGISNNYSTNSSSLLYPNPVTTQLTIGFKNANNKSFVTITDITGKIIYINESSGKQMLEINTKGFSDGIYLVRIQTGEYSETKRIIIAK